MPGPQDHLDVGPVAPLDADALTVDDAREVAAAEMLATATHVVASSLEVVEARIAVLVVQRQAINDEVRGLRADAERLQRMLRAADRHAEPPQEVTE